MNLANKLQRVARRALLGGLVNKSPVFCPPGKASRTTRRLSIFSNPAAYLPLDMLSCLAIAFSVALLLLPNPALPATVVKVDRAIHDGFELMIIHCDSLPEFSLQYDRVAGVVDLKLIHGKIGRTAAQTLGRMGSGLTIRGATVNATRGSIRFRTPAAIHIREYVVSGPAALILDFGRAEPEDVRLPFELDREDYLKLGSAAEKGGRLELALGYVEHVRQWEGSDLALTHRAGVIEQRLGRWDSDLETLAESAQIAEFAADAHARRTMIFLAKGDTASMGNEWAGYFHKDQKKAKPGEEIVTAAADTTPLAADTLPVQAEIPPPKTSFKLPQILRAGGGDSLDYLYYGWGFLAVGFLSLIGLLLSARKSGLSIATYGTVDISVPTREEGQSPGGGSDRIETYSQALLAGERSSRQSPGVAQNPLPEPRPASGYPGNPTPPTIPIAQRAYPPLFERSDPIRPRAASNRRDRVPVDEIVSLSRSGVSEGDIAHRLMVGRDEVAMVLNLSKLARGGASYRNEGTTPQSP